MSLLLLIVYGCCSILLVIYGLNVYLMIALFLRKWSSGDEEIRARDEAFARECVTHPERAPHVTTQLPLFNEYNVAERLIRAVAAMDYSADKHSIQILDDSTDETREVVDAVAAELRARGVDIEVLRRPHRVGYKAGALQYGMKRSTGDLIAIFDADFVPPTDFLKRTVPHLLADERRALVQARWGHLNDEESRLTRAQSMGVDGHFVIEQTARCRNGLFMNFCGTAGLWRKRAIVDSGGWQHDTVTEDMDLSYRAQLRGWRLVYLPNLVVPAELPASYTAFKSQQYRWAKGSIQTARKHLRALWSSPLPLLTKFEGTVHLTYYGVHLLMAVLVLLLLPLMLTYRDSIGPFDNWLFLGMLLPAMLGPSLGYLVSQRAAYPDAWGSRTLRLPFLFVVGFGICLSNSKAVLAGIFGSDTTFVRTPKAGEPGQAGRKKKVYTLGRNRLPYLELGLALYCLATLAARLLLLPTAPSDDVNRYLWEGMLVNEGVSPYTQTADDEALVGYRDGYWERMNNRDRFTAYPPLAQLVFAATDRIAYHPLAFKLLFLVLDLATLAAVLALLRHRGFPLHWSGFYAFNPIVLVGFAGEAHFDVLMVCPLVWALVVADQRRPGGAAALGALAVGAKLICAPVIPFLIGWRNPRAWLVFALVLLAPALPFLEALPALLHGLFAFGSTGEFNGPVHDLLVRGAAIPAVPAKIMVAAAFVVLWLGLILRAPGTAPRDPDRGSPGGWPLRIGRTQDAPEQSPARGTLVTANVNREPPIATTLTALLLFSPIVHFWYLTWVVPFTALRPSLHWVALSISAGAYHFVWDNARDGAWGLQPWQEVLFWGPFFLALASRLGATRLAVFRGPPPPVHAEASFSVIVPCLEAGKTLRACIESLTRQSRPPSEVILASADPAPPEIPDMDAPFPIIRQQAPLGRGNQIHAALPDTTAPWILVLHADATLPTEALARLTIALAADPDIIGGALGQRFFPPSARTLPIEVLNEARSLFGQTAFGDQGQFFRRDLALRAGLVPAQPLMEDVELSWRLRVLGRTLHLGTNVRASPTKWHSASWIARLWLVISLMARYRLARLFSRTQAIRLSEQLYRRYYPKQGAGSGPSDP